MGAKGRDGLGPHLDEARVRDVGPREEEQRPRGARVARPQQLPPGHVTHLEGPEFPFDRLDVRGRYVLPRKGDA